MARMSIHPFTGGEWTSPFKVGRGPDYQALTDSVLFEPAVAGGYTLTADAGAFTLTGAVVSLEFGHKVAAVAASFTLTGAGAVLRRGYVMVAAPSTFSITGSIVPLTANRRIVAASSVFALTGADVTLTYTPVLGAYTMTADVGDFGLAGGSVTLTYDPSVVQNLHGRNPRGRRVIYPDELPPVVVPVIEPLPSLAVARQGIADAKAALEAVKGARVEAQARKDHQRAVDGLIAQILQAEARYEAARVAEARIMRRLHDEDELFLLAA